MRWWDALVRRLRIMVCICTVLRVSTRIVRVRVASRWAVVALVSWRVGGNALVR